MTTTFATDARANTLGYLWANPGARDRIFDTFDQYLDHTDTDCSAVIHSIGAFDFVLEVADKYPTDERYLGYWRLVARCAGHCFCIDRDFLYTTGDQEAVVERIYTALSGFTAPF